MATIAAEQGNPLTGTAANNKDDDDYKKKEGSQGDSEAFSTTSMRSSLSSSSSSTTASTSFSVAISRGGGGGDDEADSEDESKRRRHRSFWRRMGLRSSSSSSVELRYLAGMLIAGWSMSCLTMTFGLFHVELFLTAYALDLGIYASGNAIYAAINTANDLAGAWIVDSMARSSLSSASSHGRSGMVGLAGAIFALCFLSPFFRFGPSSGKRWWWWDATHFVVSLSLYDTMYSFVAILLGSMFTDDLALDKRLRVNLMAMSRFTGILLSLVISKVGLTFWNVHHLGPFRTYVVVLALCCTMAFGLAQCLMQPRQQAKAAAAAAAKSKSTKTTTRTRKKLHLWTVITDFAQHPNFRFWIVSEMLLEGQMNFTRSFQKTFVDRLLWQNGGNNNHSWFTRTNCDWLLSLMGPLSSLAGLFIYIPIRKWGYHCLYMWLFYAKILMGLVMLMLLFGGNDASLDSRAIAVFLVLETVATSAVQGGGFHLAMSDMVTEMKHRQRLVQGRCDEPSLAGLFMGANALFVKPMESLLPIVAAWTLQSVNFSPATGGSPHHLGDDADADAANHHDDNHDNQEEEEEEEEEEVARRLYLLLVLPPFFFSIVAASAFRFYDLDRGKAEKMRKELKAVLLRDGEEEEEEEEEELLEGGDF